MVISHMFHHIDEMLNNMYVPIHDNMRKELLEVFTFEDEDNENGFKQDIEEAIKDGFDKAHSEIAEMWLQKKKELRTEYAEYFAPMRLNIEQEKINDLVKKIDDFILDLVLTNKEQMKSDLKNNLASTLERKIDTSIDDSCEAFDNTRAKMRGLLRKQIQQGISHPTQPTETQNEH